MKSLETFIQIAEKLVQQIEAIDSQRYTNHEERKEELFSQLKDTISEYNNILSVSEMNDPRIQSLASKSRQLHGQYYSYIESASCLEAILAGKTWDKPNFVSNNDLLGQQELETMRLTEQSKVAFIGGGPFPWSGIKYFYQNKADVTCIDVQPEAIYFSYQLLKSQGIENNVSLLCADARNVDYGRYTHILVSAMAIPKEEIVKQIVRTANPDAIILARSAYGLHSFFYEKFKPQFEGLDLQETLQGAKNGELLSYLLTISPFIHDGSQLQKVNN